MCWFCHLCKDLISKITSNLWSCQNGNLILLYMWYVHVHLNFNPYIYIYVKSLKFYSQFALNSGAQGLTGFPLQWSPCWKRLELHHSGAKKKKKNPVSIVSHSKAAIYFILFYFCKQHINCKHIILQCCLFVFCVCVKVVCRLLKNTVIFVHHMVFMDFHQKFQQKIFFRELRAHKKIFLELRHVLRLLSKCRWDECEC